MGVILVTVVSIFCITKVTLASAPFATSTFCVGGVCESVFVYPDGGFPGWRGDAELSALRALSLFFVIYENANVVFPGNHEQGSQIAQRGSGRAQEHSERGTRSEGLLDCFLRGSFADGNFGGAGLEALQIDSGGRCFGLRLSVES